MPRNDASSTVGWVQTRPSPTQLTSDGAHDRISELTSNGLPFGRTRTKRSRARLAQLVAERDAARAERAVAVEQERLRAAREMHDVIAHRLAAILALTQGAQFVRGASGAETEQVAAALESISTLGRDALGETREFLAGLRFAGNASQTDPVDLLVRLRQISPRPSGDDDRSR